MITFFTFMIVSTVLAALLLAWGVWKEEDGPISIGMISLFFLGLLGWFGAGMALPVRTIETKVPPEAVERVSSGLVVGTKIVVTDHIEVVWFNEKVGTMWFTQNISPYGNITSSRYEVRKNP